MGTLPNTEDTQDLIIEYVEHIINNEFPTQNEGDTIIKGAELIKGIQRAVYDYNPIGSQQTVLYNKSMELVNLTINLRVTRLYNAETSVNGVLWWVTILDSILIIIMTWFLSLCPRSNNCHLCGIWLIYHTDIVLSLSWVLSINSRYVSTSTLQHVT